MKLPVPLPSWFWPTVYTTILFVIGVLVSLFADEIKAYWKRMPQESHAGLMLKHEQELRLLERLHGNSYELLMWALWNFCDVMRYSLYIFVVRPSSP